MKHFIDPTVDCVFKALLGNPRQSELLCDFLNSIIEPARPVTGVEILNPYNEQEFMGDKLTIVDLKATDAGGTVYQVEIQLAAHRWLPARMLYNWSDLYQQQLGSGDHFEQLKPAVCIWILTSDLLPQSHTSYHCFSAHDPEHEVTLSPHFAIHVLELGKWRMPQLPLAGRDRWLYFLKEASKWKQLPEAIDTPEMRNAMSVLREFSEKQLNYLRYQARQDALREKWAQEDERALMEEESALVKRELAGTKEELTRVKEERARVLEERTRAEEEKARAGEEKARAEEEKARAEEEARQLRKLLLAHGIDPDTAS
jgi:predicted transposase/invertase (TIGR01784 family)